MEEENTHISHLSCHPPLTEGINGCHTQDDIDKIDGDKTRKRKVTPEQRERQRKVAKIHGELCCPVCEVTMWPGTVEQHCTQERHKLETTPISLAHSKKRQSSTSRKEMTKDKKLIQHAKQVLDSVRRREILFNQSAASGSSSTSLPSSSDTSGSMTTCPVCTCPLPCDEGVAEIHVNECLRRAQEEEEGGSGSSEEEGQYYTWCNVTRVRATSLLSPQARANMFDGTVISKGSADCVDGEDEVDVEDDETGTYGLPQFDESDVQSSMLTEESVEGVGATEESQQEIETKEQQLRCLICIDSYHKPLVSIKCWHVYCEKCWLKALATKKLCPKCKDITSVSDLRKIFL